MPDTPHTNGADWNERAEFLRQSIESHDRQLGEITDRLAATDRQLGEITERLAAMDGKIAQILEISANNAATAESLLAIAQAHETRIGRLEGGAQ